MNGLSFDNELTAEHWKQIVSEYKEIYRKKLQRDFPQDPIEQLYLAIEAVFGSWNNQRAKPIAVSTASAMIWELP